MLLKPTQIRPLSIWGETPMMFRMTLNAGLGIEHNKTDHVSETENGITVVIPNWNGRAWLPGCLEALALQERLPGEVILVDNGSADDSVAWVKKHYPWIKLITMNRNAGFAVAVNAGIKAAGNSMICLLNSDTIPAPSWLDALYRALRAADDTIGAVCGKMLRLDQPDRIENAGDTFSWQGAAEKRGYNQPAALWNAPGEVFSVCAGGALYRKAFFDVVGLFDEHFFAYLEDIDLGLRGRLMGFRYEYVPGAEMLHQGHGSGLPSSRYVRLTTANRLRIVAKNIPAHWLLKRMFSLLYGQWYFLLGHRRPWSSLLGWIDFMHDLPHCYHERKRIQNTSRIPFPAEALQAKMTQPGIVAAVLQRLRVSSDAANPGSRIVYLTTVPPPALPGSDAVLQDVEALQKHFGGEHLSLYPFKKPSRLIPGWMMGWRQHHQLRLAAASAAVLHVFNATLKPLPALPGLKRPIIYSVKASLGLRLNTGWFNRHHVTVVVNNVRDEARAREAGLHRVVLVKPGLKLDAFTWCSPLADAPFRLLIGSAPWTKAQFKTKGIDAMIEAARLMPDLHLVFLWRNLWREELQYRLNRAGITHRVTIHEEFVNVNNVLAGCHAAVVLAAHERLVKAWPHSAIEGLAAGRPVILSRVIPMADYVETENVGQAVERVDAGDLIAAIMRIRQGGALHQGERIRTIALRDFSLATMIRAHEEIYRDLQVTGSAPQKHTALTPQV